MPLIRLSSEAFRRHARIFRTRRGLHDVKQVEADRLLDFHGGALHTVFPDIPDPDIAAAPEIVHVLLLGGEQLLEPLGHYAIQRPLSAAAEFLSRSRFGGMIDYIFGELDRMARQGLDCEDDLAEVVSVDNLLGMRARSLQAMVSGTCHGQP